MRPKKHIPAIYAGMPIIADAVTVVIEAKSAGMSLIGKLKRNRLLFPTRNGIEPGGAADAATITQRTAIRPPRRHGFRPGVHADRRRQEQPPDRFQESVRDPGLRHSQIIPR